MPYAAVNGAELFYADSGQGPPLVLGHGYAGSHDSWEPVAARLEGRFRCVRIDFRGAGDSNQAKGPCTLGQFADDVVALADHLGLDLFSYAGLSMGGAVGMQLGLRHAERLEKLVLVAPAPADGIPADLPVALPNLVESGDADAIARQMRTSFARPVSDEFLQSRVQRLLTVSEEHLTDAWRSLVDFHEGDNLGRIQTPTLMVSGAADGLLAANLADFARLGNGTLHVFSRVGHQVTIDVSNELADVIADFLEHGVVTAATLLNRV